MENLQNLDYKHVHHFWQPTKSGAVAKAGEQFRPPRSVSAQMRLLEYTAGEPPWRRRFPHGLDPAPLLLPGDDWPVRPRLLRWMDDLGLRPRIVGDFDDTAVMKAFGSAGAGVFVMPSSVGEVTCQQFQVGVVGQTDEVPYQTCAISGERRLKHPAEVAISEAAPGKAAEHAA